MTLGGRLEVWAQRFRFLVHVPVCWSAQIDFVEHPPGLHSTHAEDAQESSAVPCQRPSPSYSSQIVHIFSSLRTISHPDEQANLGFFASPIPGNSKPPDLA